MSVTNKPFNIIEFIQTKRDCLAHSNQAIHEFIKLVHEQQIPDYQISAWLMAVAINGMNDQEIYALTESIIASGNTYHFGAHDFVIVDKHSTGGIGDKVSLILVPLLVASGLGVGKLSGKGLGFTGGTIDKLNGLGCKTDYPISQALADFQQDKLFIIEQSADIAQVDKVLYALRDTTATAMSLPLMAASIMSKKLALKTDYLFLDVKFGSGSFCTTLKQAHEFARIVTAIAKQAGANLSIHCTSMQQPLGWCVGNLVELLEVHEFFHELNVAPDLYQLIKTFYVDIISLTQQCSKVAAEAKFEAVYQSRKAYQVLTNWLIKHGVNQKSWEQKTFFQPKYQQAYYASTSGYFNVVANDHLGRVCNHLGAGRLTKTMPLDYQAGMRIHHKINDYVEAGELICTLYSNSPISDVIVSELDEVFSISLQPVDLMPLILDYSPN